MYFDPTSRILSSIVMVPHVLEATRRDRSVRKPRKLFTSEEDENLIKVVEQFGLNSWAMVAEQLPGRTSRQCKERYFTYLCPSVKKSPWTEEEDRLLCDKVAELGQRWSDIAKFFDGRTANSVKNRWHLHVRGHHAKAASSCFGPMVGSSAKHDQLTAMCRRKVLPDVRHQSGVHVKRYQSNEISSPPVGQRQAFPSLVSIPLPAWLCGGCP
jgi:hypothetical protein